MPDLSPAGLPEEDELALFANSKSRLRDGVGRSYGDFRKTLSPRYALVWMQILSAYGVLSGTAWALATLDASSLSRGEQVLAALAGATIIGYVIAFLALWLHEASHFNILADRGRNDLAANIFLGSLLGLDVREYRKVHFSHHRLLGMPGDPERSYFTAMTVRFLLGALLGLQALRVLFFRRSVRSKLPDVEEAGTLRARFMKLLGVVIHGGIVAAAILSGKPVLAVAWTVGVVMVFPFFGAVRQLLEHRRVGVANDVDFTQTPHGALSRVFGSGLFARTFGGAGFNRHLIHHWDMTLSCTRFAEMERYLKETTLGDHYRMRETTYWRTFTELFSGF